MVEFFAEHIHCLHCGSATHGVVIEHSAQITCSECEEIIFDASDTEGGTVIILELDDAGSVH